MTVIGDFRVAAESFALDSALAADPAVTVEADRLASHSRHGVMPFLWAAGGDLEAFERAVATDSTVDSVDVAGETDESKLLRIDWTEAVNELVDEMIDLHAAILRASARRDTWRLKLRFAEEAEVTTFREHFAKRGTEFVVTQLNRAESARQRTYGLTSAQYEALSVARELGYYGVPRAVSVEDLADELGISSNATSQRLRRGTAALLDNTLEIEDDDGGETELS